MKIIIKNNFQKSILFEKIFSKNFAKLSKNKIFSNNKKIVIIKGFLLEKLFFKNSFVLLSSENIGVKKENSVHLIKSLNYLL